MLMCILACSFLPLLYFCNFKLSRAFPADFFLIHSSFLVTDNLYFQEQKQFFCRTSLLWDVFPIWKVVNITETLITIFRKIHRSSKIAVEFVGQWLVCSGLLRTVFWILCSARQLINIHPQRKKILPKTVHKTTAKYKLKIPLWEQNCCVNIST